VEEDSLQLGDELGSGGQGRVLRVLGQPGPLVYKQYKITGADPAALRNLVDLPSMLRETELEHLLRVTSWPLARVMRHGQVRGFLMQAIPDHFFGPNAAGTPKLRELQFLLYPPKPMWGDIIPPGITAQTRIEVATEFTRLMRLLHDNALVFGDISMSNVLWAPGTPARIFVIDCDGIRKVGARPVLKQADTPDWDDPHQPPSGPDLDTDRYKLALLIGRAISAKPYIRPHHDDLTPVEGVPPPIADRMRPLWSQAAGPWGQRPDSAQWLTALSGRIDIQLGPLGQVRQRPAIPVVEMEGSGSRPVIQVKPSTGPPTNPGRTTRP
jgi:hypothetical protein